MVLSSLFGSSRGGDVSNNSADSGAADFNTDSQSLITKIKDQLSQELAVANATELVNRVSDNCFEQCMRAPYSERGDVCVDACLAKYMRSWNIVSRTYVSRIQQAAASGELK